MNTYCKTCTLSFLFLFCFGLSSKGQNQNLRFEHIGSKEGITASVVTAILQDSRGYIWVGTTDGLNKYDGYTFIKYQFDPSDSNSISQNFIYTIWEDKTGSIWVGTFEGLCRFDRSTEKFTRYKPSPKAKFSDPNIGSINEDKNGMMWVGNLSGGLCRFDRLTGKFLPDTFDLGYRKLQSEQSGDHDMIACIYRDPQGTLWIGNTTGLHQFNVTIEKTGQPSRISIKHYKNSSTNPGSISSNIVMSVFADRDGTIWVATDKGLNSFDRKTGLFKRYFHDPDDINSISSNKLALWYGSSITEDQAGNLWICTDNGLNKLNKERTAFSHYKHDPDNINSISSNSIACLEMDQDGNLWTGSLTGILDRANLNHKAFGLRQKDPNNINSLSNNQVTAILEDTSGIVWIGTYGGGLNRWNRKTDQFTHFSHNPTNPKTLRSDIVNAILEDHHGHIWVCNGDILSRLNKETNEFTHYSSNELNYKVPDQLFIFSITEDRDGLIWLGTGNGLKNFDEKTGKFKHYYHDPGNPTSISDYTATSVFADSRDNIWVGYGSIATDKLNKRTGKITPYKHLPGDSTSISSNIVHSFYEDSTGILWMGTLAGGLCQFDYKTEKFTTYTIKHGLPNNSIYSIVEDNQKQLWLGTDNGLSRLDPFSKNFTNYDYVDGLQSNVFNAGYRGRGGHLKGRDGTLYFGGTDGFNFFNPVEIKANSQASPIVITQFKIFDKLVKGGNESKEIVLAHDQNYFSFEFSSLSYFNPAKNQYAYMLEGVDKDWVFSGSRRYAGYTNISPGKYTFKVKGTNNDGVWNEKGTSIAIIITPPWWRTIWAYCFYGLCFVAGIFIIDRFQRKALIKKERERSKDKELQQAREIEAAYRHLQTTQAQLIQSEKMASLGELTAGIAHEIQNPLNFVNNFSEVNSELIAEMKQEIENGNINQAKSIAADILENEQKIMDHGKRAAGIVKGMLQHSRTSTGVKEPTDLNQLADEYLRLAFHGFKAKDKTFNATLETNYDRELGLVNIIPQDIGRVILNLITNSFYAVTEKKMHNVQDYEPKISVSTKRLPDKIIISVRDNGIGVPSKVLDRIFQPFFTTKPTGRGTGLGLSLSYDIIKSHGGELTVKTREGEFAEFIIELPS